MKKAGSRAGLLQFMAQFLAGNDAVPKTPSGYGLGLIHAALCKTIRSGLLHVSADAPP